MIPAPSRWVISETRRAMATPCDAATTGLRRSRMRLGSIAFSIAFLLSAFPVEAQILTGNIIGTVTDESRSVSARRDGHADLVGPSRPPARRSDRRPGPVSVHESAPWHLHPRAGAVGIRHLPGGGSPGHHRRHGRAESDAEGGDGRRNDHRQRPKPDGRYAECRSDGHHNPGSDREHSRPFAVSRPTSCRCCPVWSRSRPAVTANGFRSWDPRSRKRPTSTTA